jgi:hypothetical protein
MPNVAQRPYADAWLLRVELPRVNVADAGHSLYIVLAKCALHDREWKLT